MAAYAIEAPAQASVAIAGSDARFPVHRIYCIGRNYADHAKEMGASVDRERPTFFLKPADAVVDDGAAIPYPPATTNLHHEVELVVALSGGGRDLDEAQALAAIYGYAVGIDLTRRDLQAAAKKAGGPWDTAKGFDCSAPISAIVPAIELGHPRQGALWLDVNGTRRQESDIADMVHGIEETLVLLSRLFELRAGDLLFTGTPAGVGPLVGGDSYLAGFGDHLRLSGRIL